MKIGIHGGSFNPIHVGHIALCREFIRLAGLDTLLLMPVNVPPHKLSADLASNEDRYNMARLAARADRRIKVSDIELKREGKSYTIDTVRQLEELYPDAEFYLIMGADMFVTLHEWKESRALLEKCVICTAERDDIGRGELTEYAERMGMDMTRVMIAPMMRIDVSSTLIRERVRAGLGTDGLLDLRVERYIKKHGLYVREPAI